MMAQFKNETKYIIFSDLCLVVSHGNWWVKCSNKVNKINFNVSLLKW